MVRSRWDTNEPTPWTEENMKRIGLVLAVAVLAASILSGCVILPLDGGYGYRGYHDRPYARDHRWR